MYTEYYFSLQPRSAVLMDVAAEHNVLTQSEVMKRAQVYNGFFFHEMIQKPFLANLGTYCNIEF